MAEKFADNLRFDQEIQERDNDIEDYQITTTQNIIFLIECTKGMVSPTLQVINSPEISATPGFTSTAFPGSIANSRIASKTTQFLDFTGKPAQSNLELILRTAYSMMLRKISSNPKDKIGIYVWDCVTSNEDLKGGIASILKLGVSTKERLETLKSLLRSAENRPGYLETKFQPGSDQSGLYNAFLAAKRDVSKDSTPTTDKLIYLFTDNDFSLAAVDDERLTARNINLATTQLGDMSASNVEVIQYFIPTSGQFNVEKYWTRVFPDDDLEEDAILPLEVALRKMIQNINTSATKRTAFRLKFELAPDLCIGIKGYNLIGVRKKRAPIFADLRESSGQVAESKTTYTDSFTDQILEYKDLIRYMPVGKDGDQVDAEGMRKNPSKVFLSPEQLNQMRSVGMSVGMKLIGFKPIEKLVRPEWTIATPAFLQADEQVYEGSIRTMAGLNRLMLEKKVAALVCYLPRISGKPCMAVLQAQAEIEDSDGNQLQPPGLNLTQLPFADDIRGLPKFPESCRSLLDQLKLTEPSKAKKIHDAMELLIKNYRKVHNPASFPNPALNYYLDSIAAAAMGEPPIRDPVDATKPTYGSIKSRCESSMRDLRFLIDQEERIEELVTVVKKPRIKQEKAALDRDNVPEGWLKLYLSPGNELYSLRNVELSAGLSAMGLPHSGTKLNMVERVVAAFRTLGLIEEGSDVEMKSDNDDDDAEEAEEEDFNMDDFADSDVEVLQVKEELDVKPKKKIKKEENLGTMILDD